MIQFEDEQNGIDQKYVEAAKKLSTRIAVECSVVDGLTQASIEKSVGLGRNFINKRKSGYRTMTLAVAVALLDQVGMTLEIVPKKESL